MSDVIVKLYVDVIDVLQSGRLDGALFGFDTSVIHGSLDLGTDELATMVAPGDSITWIVNSLECEAYVNVVDLELPAWLQPERTRVAERDFWRAVVTGEPVPSTYAVTLAIGRYGKRVRHAGRLRLIPRPAADLAAIATPQVVSHDAPVGRMGNQGDHR